MFCENCLNNIIIPKLREDDIALLEHLYNNGITFAQIALDKSALAKALNISQCRSGTAVFRLECFNMVQIATRSRLYCYFITEDGTKALEILSKKMGGD